MTTKEQTASPNILTNGFILIPRSFLNWEWYTNIFTRVLFEHLVMTANWEDKNWCGMTVKRGQRVCSVAVLARETGLSVRNVRTAINHLKSTNELTSESTSGNAPKCTLFTVVNYDKFQSVTNDMTNDRQIGDKSVTNDRQQLNKYNKENKYNNIKKGCGQGVARTPKESVCEFCLEDFTERPL